MKLFLKTAALIISVLLIFAGPAAAETITVAVATNFLRTAEQLAALFTRETGIKVVCSGSSTGRLYAQIVKGAPYDIFLAADAQRPELLHAAGLAAAPQTYALGRVALWTKDRNIIAADWQQALATNTKPIAIASPEIAPYGEAAAAALKNSGLWQTISPRLVFAQSAGQAFQYAEQGATAFSFAALSYAVSETGKNGQSWPIPNAPPVVQKGCILSRSVSSPGVRHFFEFINSPAAREIIIADGYQ